MSTRGAKCVLIDLSGTLHIEDEEVPGSVEALKRLRESDLKVRFVTNTTKESKRVLLQRLNQIGFDVALDDVFTSLTAAHDAVREKKLRPMLLLDDRAMEDFDDIDTEDPNAVVVGLAPDKFHYDVLNSAFRLLLNGCPLIAVHKGRYYRRKDGLALGPGPFVAGLEYATGTTAEVVGKPETRFFLSAIRDMDCQPGQCVMIGDDVRDDVGGSQTAGMIGILVKTGKYQDGDEGKISPPPSHVASDFPHAVDIILGSQQQCSS
ncbi:haloacid dehalogenase-like hydrolase domain-containing protein 2 [Haliotis rufescens]|uniref:haloacid dehalogenase-like hydrolase domain-containing protein 2 n=1 Tax=Haliotis rufescens TaxID=6454 RepID=UPI00201EE7CF|nr:haloacid dehalogenase-like hydrolase domain-containing protein 2 [Haliotis rufescens]